MKWVWAPLVAVCSVAFAGPQLGMDRSVDAPIIVGAPFNQDSGSIAYGAGIYMAVWRSIPDPDPKFRIYASPVDASGNATTPAAILVAASNSAHKQPTIAFDGSQFVVAWVEAVGGVDHLFTVTLSPAGVLGAPTDRTATATVPVRTPVLAAGDGLALLAWEQAGVLEGQIVGGASPIPLTFPASSGAQAVPAAVFGNHRFLVAWYDDSDPPGPDVLAATVGTNGTVGAPFRGITQYQPDEINTPGQLALGYGGSHFLMAFTYLIPGVSAHRDIFVRLVDDTGAPQGSDVKLSHDATAADGHFDPQVTFAGGNFVVAWEGRNMPPACTSCSHIYGNRVSTAGAVVDPTDRVLDQLGDVSSPLLPDDQWRPTAIASDGTNLVLPLTFRQSVGSLSDVLGLPVTGTVAPTAASGVISRAPNSERSLVTASNGTLSLAVWKDSRTIAGTTLVQLYGRLVDIDGVPQGGGAFSIGTAQADRTHAVGALPGGDFMVAWVDANGFGDIRAARISPAGGVRDVAGIAVGASPTPEIEPTVAGGTDRWIVAWNDQHNDASMATLESRIVRSDGTQLAQVTFATPSTDFTVDEPSATWEGNRFFVAYVQKTRAAGPVAMPEVGSVSVAGRFVATDGTATGTPQAIGAWTGPRNISVGPAAVANMGQVAVFWRQSSSGIESIVGSSFVSTAGGSSLPMIPVVVGQAGNVLLPPRAAAAGDKVLVTWTLEQRNVPDAAYAARVRLPIAVGSVIDAPPFALSDTPAVASRSGGITAQTDGRALYVYEKDETFGMDVVSRAHTRAGSVRQLGDSCTSAGGCGMGVCVDGICCESDCNRYYPCDSLNTACVDYVPRNRCQGSGICFAPADARACAAQIKPDGTACSTVGCTGAAQCTAGACRCGQFAQVAAGAPIAPQFANPGCSALPVGQAPSSRASGLGLLALLLFSGWAFGRGRQRAAGFPIAILLFWVAASCTDDKGGLIARMNLAAVRGQPIARVRLILRSDDPNGFVAQMPATVQPSGVVVRYTDVNGDGALEASIDVDKAYIRGDSLSVELSPRIGGSFGVRVHAWVLTPEGLRIADAQSAQSARIVPGEKPTVDLDLRCRRSDCGPVWFENLEEMPQKVVDPWPAEVGSLAAGARGTSDPRPLIALANPGLATGKLLAWIGLPPVQLLQPDLGERTGAALGIADWNGDGTSDLLAGAPASLCNAGAVVEYPGGVPGTPLDGGADGAVVDGSVSGCAGGPPAALASGFELIGHGELGDEAGASLASADLDGDGRKEVVIGAPSGRKVYLLRPTKSTLMVSAAMLSGFGSAVAAAQGRVLVGAPGAAKARMYELRGDQLEMVLEWSSSGGAFGAAVALADLDGAGTVDPIVGAPIEGSGVVYMLRGEALPGATADRSQAWASISGGAEPLHLGSSLAIVPGPAGFGALLVLSALGEGQPGYVPALVVVPGSALIARPFFAVGDVGAPATRLTASGAQGLWGPPASADTNADGVGDVLWAGPQGLAVFKGVSW